MKQRVRELTALVMAVCMICGGIWFAKSAAYAAEVADTYTLTWMDDASDLINGDQPITYDTQNLAVGTQIELPNDPTKTGYVFIGWMGYGPNGFAGTQGEPWGPVSYKQDSIAEFNALGIKMPDRDITVLAEWQPIIYKIQFAGGAEDVNGLPETIEGTEDIPIYYQDIIDLPKDEPSRINYQFAGWDYDGTIYSPGGTFTVPDAPTDIIINGVATLTLTAVWANSNGSTIGAGQHYLMQSYSYTLRGATKVEGDTGQYTDGITFYVPSNGYYTFSQ